MYQVDSEDANFLFLEKAESPTHISLIYLYDQSSLGDQPVRFSHIREHMRNRINSAPVFCQKIPVSYTHLRAHETILPIWYAVFC